MKGRMGSLIWKEGSCTALLRLLLAVESWEAVAYGRYANEAVEAWEDSQCTQLSQSAVHNFFLLGCEAY